MVMMLCYHFEMRGARAAKHWRHSKNVAMLYVVGPKGEAGVPRSAVESKPPRTLPLGNFGLGRMSIAAFQYTILIHIGDHTPEVNIRKQN